MTTLTKRTAEELTDYLRDIGINVRYLHSEIDAIERVEILRALRKGEFDVLVGINLLREGLDLPEVSLVAILDADKEGYLRSATSLIQTAGRAARHLNGEVILYADVKTQSIQKFLAVSGLPPARSSSDYNREHGITPAQREPGHRGEPFQRRHDETASRRGLERGGGQLRRDRDNPGTGGGNARRREQPGVRKSGPAPGPDPRAQAPVWPGQRPGQSPGHQCRGGDELPGKKEAALTAATPTANLPSVPTVMRIGPYRFHFYSRENAGPPHIHVEREVSEAKFWLRPVALGANHGF